MELSEQLLTSIGTRSYGHRHYLLKTIRGVLQSASSFSLMPAMQEHVQPVPSRKLLTPYPSKESVTTWCERYCIVGWRIWGVC